VGYDLLAAVFFVAITPFVLAGFVLFWVVNARDHEELASLWRAFARRRGLELIEPEGDWPNRTSPELRWTDAASGARFRITTSGREARVCTRLVVRPRSALLGTFAMQIGGAGARPVIASERPARFSDRIVTAQVMRTLLGFRQHDRVVVTYRRGRVVVEWPGGESSDARLEEAMRLGAEIARTIDEEFRGAATASARQPAA
jgi:hypothetical protein